MGVELFKKNRLQHQRDLAETFGGSGIMALETDSGDDNRRGFRGDSSNVNRRGWSGDVESLQIVMNWKGHC